MKQQERETDWLAEQNRQRQQQGAREAEDFYLQEQQEPKGLGRLPTLPTLIDP